MTPVAAQAMYIYLAENWWNREYTEPDPHPKQETISKDEEYENSKKHQVLYN